MMLPRPGLLRALLPFLAAALGFFAGLIAGGLAEILIVPLVLFVTGHPHPLGILDASFHSDPPGPLAFAMIAGYFTTAFLGAMAAYKTVRSLSAQWTPPAQGSATAFLNPMRNVWRNGGAGKKALLVALPILTLLLQTISVRERQSALACSTSQPTPEKSAPLSDHGRIFYATFHETRTISHWEIASFLVTFSTLAYAFHVFRLKDLVVQVFAIRSATGQKTPNREERRQP